MPTPGRLVRLEDSDWQQLGELAAAAGTDRSAVLRQLAAWWTRQPGARLPARPPEEQARASWAARQELEQAAAAAADGQVVNGYRRRSERYAHVSAGQRGKKSSQKGPQQSPAL